jgi:hypothetical protein
VGGVKFHHLATKKRWAGISTKDFVGKESAKFATFQGKKYVDIAIFRICRQYIARVSKSF